jgi:hypothetical protein
MILDHIPYLPKSSQAIQVGLDRTTHLAVLPAKSFTLPTHLPCFLANRLTAATIRRSFCVLETLRCHFFSWRSDFLRNRGFSTTSPFRIGVEMRFRQHLNQSWFELVASLLCDRHLHRGGRGKPSARFEAGLARLNFAPIRVGGELGSRHRLIWDLPVLTIGQSWIVSVFEWLPSVCLCSDWMWNSGSEYPLLPFTS